ncbi:MAG TPA: hypothetical protein VF411_04805 [Bacteroidia bacterium]
MYKTVIVNIPEKEATFFLSMLKKLRFKSQVLSEEELEDEALARWIDEGLKSEDVPIEKVFRLLEKHGAKS